MFENGVHIFPIGSYFGPGSGVIFDGTITCRFYGQFHSGFQLRSGEVYFSSSQLDLPAIMVNDGTLSFLEDVIEMILASLEVTGGTVTFYSPSCRISGPLVVRNVAVIIFYGPSVLSDVSLYGNSYIDYRNNALADGFALYDSAQLYASGNDSTIAGRIVVRYYFRWAGLNTCISNKEGIAGVGSVVLEKDSIAVINGTGLNQYLAYVTLEAHGYVDFYPIGNWYLR
jgi:hypothetical protein